MKTLNLNDTNLYKKNITIHNNLFKVYLSAIALSGLFLLFRGIF